MPAGKAQTSCYTCTTTQRAWCGADFAMHGGGANKTMNKYAYGLSVSPLYTHYIIYDIYIYI